MIILPDEVKLLLEKLNINGYSAYAVGGCIRDSILNIEPKDWDICTSAKPDEIIKIFRCYNVIETGLKHGTVTVRINHKSYEVTTYRVDGTYSDCRKPDFVNFVDDVKMDLSRRDFTVNAMAYNEVTGLIDVFGGKDDLNNKIIRCVGNPDKRFKEDALRILRAMRFASTYGFVIEKETAEAMHKNKDLLKNISVERITDEFLKMLCQKSISSILDEFKDIVAVFIPEIKDTFDFQQNNPYHYTDVWHHIIDSVEMSEQIKEIRFALFLHDIEKPACYFKKNNTGHFYGHAEKSAKTAHCIMRRMKMPNDFIKSVELLVKYHDIMIGTNKKSIKKYMNILGEEGFKALLEVKKADFLAHSEYAKVKDSGYIEEIESIYYEIIGNKEPFSLKHLEINGTDIIRSTGTSPGPYVGIILKKLLGEVLEEKIPNNKTELIKRAEEISRNEKNK